MSSRRRPYLNLKQSILELFRTPAHWLKEFTGKWSIFDKPYLDQDYRGMHLDWPALDWPTGKKWPDLPPTHIFLWDPGICWLSPINADCGEEFDLSVTIGLLPLWSMGTTIDFFAYSSEPEHVRITGIEIFGSPFFSATVKGEIADDWTGTAVICVEATLKGQITTGVAVGNPYGEGPGILSYEEALKLPKLWSAEPRGWWYDCGCIDVEVVCCLASALAWDSDTSATTVAREDSCTVAITDSEGTSGPYTWTVSGTGYTLDDAITTGLTNTLNADASACGVATITVTGCGETEAIGYVRCTTGEWTVIDLCITAPDYYYGEGKDCTDNQWTGYYADPRYMWWVCGSCYYCQDDSEIYYPCSNEQGCYDKNSKIAWLIDDCHSQGPYEPWGESRILEWGCE